MYPFKFETYQDVKLNLAVVMLVALYVAWSAAFYLILPPEHRRALTGAMGWLGHLGMQLGSLTVMGVIAAFLIYGIQIHDGIYDKYIVKWRATYDTSFILPKLCEPYRARLDPSFDQVASANSDTFMRELFYEYVHDRQPKIRQNALTRFYERITNYWATQIVEMIAYLGLLLSAIYMPVYRLLHLSERNPWLVLLGAGLVLLVNGILSKQAVAQVSQSTTEEIQEIHSCCMEDLGKQIAKVSQQFGLKFH